MSSITATDRAGDIAGLVADACADLARHLVAEGFEGGHFLAAFERMRGIVVRAVVAGTAVSAPVTGVRAAQDSAARAAKGARINPDSRPAALSPPKPASVPRAAPVFVPIKPPKGAKAIGMKALDRAGLRQSAVKVGMRLLEHFNLDTGRCDPGNATLARGAGIAGRSVRRGLEELISRGLFGRIQHGGHAHTNAYSANWQLMMELAASGESGSTRTLVAANPDPRVRQNHFTKPDSNPVLVKAQRGRAEPDRRQKSFVYPIDGGRTNNRDAVRLKIKRQLNERMEAFDKNQRTYVWEVLVDGDWEAAVSAEMARNDSGLPALLGAVEAASLRKAAG